MNQSRRRYKDYDESMLNIAVSLVQNKNISSYDAEKQFGIPCRTILNKVKQKHLKSIGGPTILSPADEQKIASCLILCGEYGYLLTSMELRSIVHDYLVKNGLSGIFNHKMPGTKWVRNFLRRHRNILTMRSTTNIKEYQANKSVQDYITYFENLKVSLHNVKPENIINYDETNFSDNPGSQKCIFKVGTKHPNKILNNTKTAISVMFSAAASGIFFPPYVVYKADNLWTNWCTNGPEGTRYNRTKSGWFDADTFEDWFNSIIIPWAEKTPDPKVLIGDNLSSHMNISIISKCQELNIRFIFLPPNSTHHTQPLDVAFFGPLKREWRRILMDYKVRHPSANTLNKQIFPELLKMLVDASKLTQSKNIISGFCATGIHPINPEIILKKLPDYCKHQTNFSFDETFVNYLQHLRTPAQKKKKNANKKLFIEPGKSVCVNDLLNTNTKKQKYLMIPSDVVVNVDKNLRLSKDKGLFREVSDVDRFNGSSSLKSVVKKSRSNRSSSESSGMYTIHDSSCDGHFLTSNSDTETYVEEIHEVMEYDPEKENNNYEISIDRYVLVKFVTPKLIKYYIGLVTKYNSFERVYTVKYLRKNSKGTFYWPEVDDISEITLLDVEKPLPNPQVGRRGELKFDLDNLSIALSKIF